MIGGSALLKLVKASSRYFLQKYKSNRGKEIILSIIYESGTMGSCASVHLEYTAAVFTEAASLTISVKDPYCFERRYRNCNGLPDQAPSRNSCQQEPGQERNPPESCFNPSHLNYRADCASKDLINPSDKDDDQLTMHFNQSIALTRCKQALQSAELGILIHGSNQV